MKKLSILVTYHDEQSLLTECLNSIFEQTVLPDEVVIYDDASKYPAEDYLISNSKVEVRLIKGKENIMLAASRNKLMEFATGEYIRYQDADDLLEPNCVEEIKKVIINNPSVDLVVNEVRAINFETGAPISNNVMSLNTVSGSLVSFAIAGSLLAPSTTFKRDLGLALNGYKAGKLLQCEDFEFNIRLSYYSSFYKIITTPLVIQRVRSNSMSSNKLELYREAVKALDLLENELPQEYKTDLGQAYSRVGHNLFKLKDYENSKNAFSKAKTLGSTYKGRSKLFGITAKLFGQMSAEIISEKYQQLKKLL